MRTWSTHLRASEHRATGAWWRGRAGVMTARPLKMSWKWRVYFPIRRSSGVRPCLSQPDSRTLRLHWGTLKISPRKRRVISQGLTIDWLRRAATTSGIRSLHRVWVNSTLFLYCRESKARLLFREPRGWSGWWAPTVIQMSSWSRVYSIRKISTASSPSWRLSSRLRKAKGSFSKTAILHRGLFSSSRNWFRDSNFLVFWDWEINLE